VRVAPQIDPLAPGGGEGRVRGSEDNVRSEP